MTSAVASFMPAVPSAASRPAIRQIWWPAIASHATSLCTGRTRGPEGYSRERLGASASSGALVAPTSGASAADRVAQRADHPATSFLLKLGVGLLGSTHVAMDATREQPRHREPGAPRHSDIDWTEHTRSFPVDVANRAQHDYVDCGFQPLPDCTTADRTA